MKAVTQKLKSVQQGLAQKRRDYLAKRPHRSFRKTKPSRTPLRIATVNKNVIESFQLIWREKKLLGGMALVYMVVTYVFIGGVAQADFVGLKEATLEVLGGSLNSFGTAVSLLTSTMTGAFSAQLSELQQFLAILIGVLFWLGLVWALRMRFADQKITIRDALYSSAAPLVAYTLLALIIIAQLTPGAIGLFVLSIAQSGGWLQGGVEVMAFSLAAVLLCCLSLYWLSGSLLALVVVTLPQMYPWRALQIASELVIGRRIPMLLHMLVLFLILFLTWVGVLLPVLVLDGWLRLDWLPLLPLAVQALSAFTLVYFAAYVYKLYRSLI